MKRRELLSDFVDKIHPFFDQRGFTLKRFNDVVIFKRRCGEITLKYSFGVLTKYGLDVEPQLSIRHEETERIYHIFSGCSREGYEFAVTLAARVGYIMETEKAWWMIFPVWDKVRLPLESEEQVQQAVRKQIEFFEKCGEPTLKRYSTLDAIDRHLNDAPTKPALLAGVRGPHRSTRGIIVARLMGRSDFEELVVQHRKAVEWADKGRHLPMYDRLAKVLRENLYRVPGSGEGL